LPAPGLPQADWSVVLDNIVMLDETAVSFLNQENQETIHAVVEKESVTPSQCQIPYNQIQICGGSLF
jgi:hypothetical protein